MKAEALTSKVTIKIFKIHVKYRLLHEKKGNILAKYCPPPPPDDRATFLTLSMVCGDVQQGAIIKNVK
jgi:hypothetical protein